MPLQTPAAPSAAAFWAVELTQLHRLLSFLDWRSSWPPGTNVAVDSGNCRTTKAPKQLVHTQKLGRERLALHLGCAAVFNAACRSGAHDLSVESGRRRIPCQIWWGRLPETLQLGKGDYRYG